MTVILTFLFGALTGILSSLLVFFKGKLSQAAGRVLATIAIRAPRILPVGLATVACRWKFGQATLNKWFYRQASFVPRSLSVSSVRSCVWLHADDHHNDWVLGPVGTYLLRHVTYRREVLTTPAIAPATKPAAVSPAAAEQSESVEILGQTVSLPARKSAKDLKGTVRRHVQRKKAALQQQEPALT